MKALLWRRFGGALQTKISSKSHLQILDFPEKNYQNFHDLKCRPLFTTFPCPDPFNSFPSGFTTWNNPREMKKINFSQSWSESLFQQPGMICIERDRLRAWFEFSGSSFVSSSSSFFVVVVCLTD